MDALTKVVLLLFLSGCAGSSSAESPPSLAPKVFTPPSETEAVSKESGTKKESAAKSEKASEEPTSSTAKKSAKKEKKTESKAAAEQSDKKPSTKKDKPTLSNSKKKKVPARWAKLVDVHQRYVQAKSIEAKLEKLVKQPLLRKTVTHQGQLYVKGDKIRVEFDKPQKSLVIIDGETVWMVNHLPKELGGKAQVAQTKFDPQKQSQAWMLLLRRDDLLEHFKVKDRKKTAKQMTYTLIPKKKASDLKEVAIEIDLKRDDIRRIAYSDELDNETELTFAEVKFGTKIPASRFSYTPPKDANITVY